MCVNMYPGCKAVAELQDEKKVVTSMHYALELEKIHVTLYGEAKNTVKSGNDLYIVEIYVCPVCGHAVVGKVPER